MSDNARLKRLYTGTPASEAYTVIYTVPAGFKTILKYIMIVGTGGSNPLFTLNGSGGGSYSNWLVTVGNGETFEQDIPLSAGETIGVTTGGTGPIIVVGEEIPV